MDINYILAGALICSTLINIVQALETMNNDKTIKQGDQYYKRILSDYEALNKVCEKLKDKYLLCNEDLSNSLTDNDLKTAQLEAQKVQIQNLNRCFKFIKRGMRNNKQFEKIMNDLEGGHEERINEDDNN